MWRLGFHNQEDEKNEVYVYLSSEVVKNVDHLNPAHIGLQ